LVAGVVGLVADVVSTGLVVVTADGRVVWANRAMLGLVLPGGADIGGPDAGPGPNGRSTSAPGGLGWGAVHDDPVVAARFAVANAALPLDRVEAVPTVTRHRWAAPDGAARWLDIRRVEIDAAGAGSVGQVGADGLVLYEILDVTDSHDGDNIARRREGHRDRVEAISGTGSWEWDLTSNQMTWSDQMRLLVAPAESAPASRVVDYAEFHALLHPDDVDAVENALDAALRDGQPFAFVHRIRLPAGLGPSGLGPSGLGPSGLVEVPGGSALDLVAAGAAAPLWERVFVCVGEVLIDDLGMPTRVVAASRDVTGTPDDPFLPAAARLALTGPAPGASAPVPVDVIGVDVGGVVDVAGAGTAGAGVGVAGVGVAGVGVAGLDGLDAPGVDVPGGGAGPGSGAEVTVGAAPVEDTAGGAPVPAGPDIAGAAAALAGAPPEPRSLDPLTGLPDRAAL
jgi:PAS domain-containing protein